MTKTIAEINEKIRKGDVVVVRADEMPEIVDEIGAEKAAEKIDVVTTATFGAMCSSGAFLNFGHTDPPIKMQKVWLNEVAAYAGLAAVDAYIGATQLSDDKGIDYGGGHVIEDLVAGKQIHLKATAYRTDCYPRKLLESKITLADLNQAILYNPRNAYQRYNAATNSSNNTIHTYMGTLLPQNRNINFSGAGELSPLNNDPSYQTIGFGTRIFLAGAQGYVAGEGTQHSPTTGFGTLTVQGDLKQMDSKYLKGASIHGYGSSLMIGIGIPIPILNADIARSTAVRNKDIEVGLFDYSVPVRERPKIAAVNYEQLFSGKIRVGEVKSKTSCLSSLKKTNEILDTLSDWIVNEKFQLSLPVSHLPQETVVKPFSEKEKIILIKDVMVKKVITGGLNDTLEEVSSLLVEKDIDQVPIVKDGKAVGIVTSLDITRAVATKKKRLAEIMTAKLITAKPDETLDAVSLRLDKYGINSTPVVNDKGDLVGIITLGDINKVYGGIAK